MDRGVVGGAHALSRFSMPDGERGTLVDLLRRYPRALHPDYMLPVQSSQRRVLDTFFERRGALLALVRHHVQAKPAPVPLSAHATPAVDDCRTAAAVFQRLLAHHSGLVVGAPYTGTAARQVLIDHMDLLRRLGVDTLYVDQLQSDIHQDDLDTFHRTGRMPSALDRFLAGIDHDPLETARGSTYLELLKAAAAARVKVVPLDLAASYYLKGIEGRDDRPRQDLPELRPLMFNHVAALGIEQHQRSLPRGPGTGRWVALVPANCAGTSNGNDGLDRKLNVPSLLVQGVPMGEPPRAGHDPGWQVPPDAVGTGGELQCGYVLKVPQRGGRRPVITPEPCGKDQVQAASRLRAAISECSNSLQRIGTYRLIQLADEQVVVHRSSDGSLVAQPIVATVDGGVRLHRAAASHPQRWAHVDREFRDVKALREALDMLLVHVGDPAPSPAQH